MTPEDACKFAMPFGKYRGYSLDEIVTNDPDGARYLDWVVGLPDIQPWLKEAITVFLAIPDVAERVDRALESGESRDYSEPRENTQRPKQWWEK